jgi:autotransporter passenger strand-loop-strand repeat protein
MSVTVFYGQVYFVTAGQTVTADTVLNGGTVYIYSGGTISNTLDNGQVYVYGGTISNTLVNGQVNVYSGGTAIGTTVVNGISYYPPATPTNKSTPAAPRSAPS